MKRNALIIITLALSGIIFAVYLASCSSGGGGGGGGDGGGPVALATGTFTKNVFHIGSSSTENQFGMSTQGSRFQSLYLARDLKGSGKITSISYKYGSNNVVTAVSCPNVTMKMGHTFASSLTSTYANNVENGGGSLQTVISSAPVTILAGSAGSYFTINLATPFDYNGVDNLVVEVSRGAACTSEVGAVANVTDPVYIGILRSIPPAPTGYPNNVVLDTIFTFSGGDNAIEFVPLWDGGSTPFGAPIHIQILYLANEIKGSGPITGFGMKTAATTTTGTYIYTLKLGHTTLSQLNINTTFADNYNVGPPVTVVGSGMFTIPGGVPAETYVWIPFLSTFTYNGSDNIIVDLDISSGNVANPMRYTSTMGALRLIVGYTGSSTAELDEDRGVFHAKFRFNGGTTDVIGSSNVGVGVFSSIELGNQFLLHASELGTEGAINKLACRIASSSTATTYQDFTVTLAHTSQSALVANDATNIAGGTTVYDGPFTMPGGLLAGDWVEIPLTTAFSYNGTSNLVVQTTTGGGSPNQYCQVSGPDATRFQYRFKRVGNPGLMDNRGIFRFWIIK